MHVSAPTVRRLLVVALAVGGVLAFSSLLYRHASEQDAAGSGFSFPFSFSSSSRKEYRLPTPKSPSDHQAQARFSQALYCSQFYPLPPSNSHLKYVPIRISNFHPDPRRKLVAEDLGMYVIGSPDSANTDNVSHNITESGSWESDFSKAFLAALDEADKIGVQDPLFVDVGANLGMHSIAVLAYGYRVLSFDAMTTNGHHFRSTLCRHPQLMEKSTFILNGLGSESSTCAIGTDDLNLGDGVVTCDPAAIAQYKTNPRPPGLPPLRQWLRIDPLDTFIDEDAWLVKMDVEGFELDVLLGARGLFTRRRVPFLQVEVTGTNPAIKEKSRKMLAQIAKYGYSCSEDGWYEKRLKIPEKAEDIVVKESIYNAWCIQPKVLRAAGLGDKVRAALENV
ncbi:S-adenosyl-L-methionine-dependent methyltransferase [Zopfochytrium polystomum]|nr:S-adenosyl-L-methionine-dependent methyltransferase [Zopfochytrium polystomum]